MLCVAEERLRFWGETLEGTTVCTGTVSACNDCGGCENVGATGAAKLEIAFVREKLCAKKSAVSLASDLMRPVFI